MSAGYPSVEEFRTALDSQSLPWIVDNYILTDNAFVFEQTPNLLDELKSHLQERTGVSQTNIRIVGSAKLGYSLSPDNFPRRFSQESDIDVLAVDTELFDKIWVNVLQWHYPRRSTQLGAPDNDWMRLRRKELYWGWFHPDKIKYRGLAFQSALEPIRDISTAWFNAFQSLSIIPDLSGRVVTGRLYRTWDHAKLYHIAGLQKIKEQLAGN